MQEEAARLKGSACGGDSRWRRSRVWSGVSPARQAEEEDTTGRGEEGEAMTVRSGGGCCACVVRRGETESVGDENAKKETQSQNPPTKHTALCKCNTRPSSPSILERGGSCGKSAAAGGAPPEKYDKARIGGLVCAHLHPSFFTPNSPVPPLPPTHAQATYDGRIHALHEEEPALEAVAASDSFLTRSPFLLHPSPPSPTTTPTSTHGSTRLTPCQRSQRLLNSSSGRASSLPSPTSTSTATPPTPALHPQNHP